MREFMDEEEIEFADLAQLPKMCRYIRTKNAFGNSVGYPPWQLGTSSTAAYWCLETMTTAGPDGQLVHPQNCCVGRGCFRARGTT